jgi:hypothetical protein
MEEIGDIERAIAILESQKRVCPSDAVSVNEEIARIRNQNLKRDGR